MTQEKIRLLYIASNGRSGSTILEMMLNAIPELWTLGEFHILPWEVRINRMPCGCGAAIGECPLWGEIISQHRETILAGSIGRFRRLHNADRTIRFRQLPYIFSKAGHLASRRAAAIAKYADDNEAVLRAVVARSREIRSPDVTWLVDSSKSPYRLMWLAASQRFDLRVIHLTKDPRAFVYSMSKDVTGFIGGYRGLRAGIRWNVENRIMDSVVRRYVPAPHVLRLRYEELASQPEATLKGICEWLSVSWRCSAVSEFRGGNHGIAGNPARHENRPIELDEKWRRELSPWLARSSFLINARLAMQFGYAP